MELVSVEALSWIVTAMTGIFAGAWLVYDVRNLTTLRGKDFSDPLIRDRCFGYLMGITIAVIGLVGVLRFHGIL